MLYHFAIEFMFIFHCYPFPFSTQTYQFENPSPSAHNHQCHHSSMLYCCYLLFRPIIIFHSQIYMSKLQQQSYKKSKTQENTLHKHTSSPKSKQKNNTNASCQFPSTSADQKQNKISIISVNLSSQMPKKLQYKINDKSDSKNKNNSQVSDNQDDQQQGQKIKSIQKNKKQHQENFPVIKSSKENQLFEQNKRLRAINKQLKKQLQQFEKKLDATLKKHSQEHGEKKVKYKVGQEILQNMQLRNAYKMCEIYKRQISYLKRKQESGKQSKVDQLENNIFLLEKQKEKFLQEIKDLKKINKQQQKGLRELSGPSAINLLQQNEKLKESIRRLQNMHDLNENQKMKEKQKGQKKEQKYERQQKNNKQFVQSQDEQIQNIKKSKRKEKDTQQKPPSAYLSVQKQVRKQKQKGDSQKLRDKQIQDNELQMQKLKNRILKDHKKLTNLLGQNTKYRQYIEQLKNQLIDKDKQCSKLREKINQLREQNSQLLNNNNNQRSSSRHKRVQTEPQLASSKPHKKSLKKVLLTAERESLFDGQPLHLRELQSSEQNYFGKYPRVLQSGYRIENSFKWNHHQLSSKIKQVQIYPHPLGHIKEISFRYQKGQPNKPSGKFASFCCEQNKKQWVKSIKGGYKNGILRYLIVESNKGRRANFCQFQIQSQCANFEFKSSNSKEYLGAFFGQNTSDGISRLGCFLEIQK